MTEVAFITIPAPTRAKGTDVIYLLPAYLARLCIFIHFLSLYLNKLLAIVKSTTSIYLYT